jgi:cell division transport system permease protein
MRSLVFLFREFLGSLAQNRFLNFTYGAQVTISLLVLGIFFVFLVGAAVLWGKIGQSMEIHVFLDSTVSAQQLIALEEQLKAIPHVKSVVYRSKEQALADFQKNNGAIPLTDLLEDNPLPASYIVTADKPANISSIAGQCKELSGVLTTRFKADLLDRYLKVLMLLGAVCIITMGLLIIFTYSSINNIIALSVYARRTEIRIMQLVGATAWFIRWPFVFEGVFFGAMGAFVALITITVLMMMMGQALRLSQLTLAIPWLDITSAQLLLGLAGLLLGLGIVVGFFGSLKTVNTFLGREPEITLDALKVRHLMK